MKLIPLNTVTPSKYLDAPKFAMVDDEDYDFLMQWKWHANFRSNNFYVRSDEKVNGKYVTILMHRKILRITDSNVFIDHKDHRAWNNQKSNIRIATRTQNTINQRKRKGCDYSYIGVTLDHHSLRVRIKTPEGSRAELGRFPNTACGALLGAVTYDKAAEKYYGEFANLNFKLI